MKQVHQTESFQGSELTEGVFHLEHGRLEPIGAGPGRPAAEGGTRRGGPLSPGRWRLPGSHLPMWIYDRASGDILAANEPAARALGYPVEALVASHVWDVCPGAESLAAYARGTEGASSTARLTLRKRDGSSVEAEVGVIDPRSRAVMMIVLRTEPRPRVVRRSLSDAVDGPGPSSGPWFDGPHARTLLGVAAPVWPEDLRAHALGRRRSTVNALVELLGPQLDEVGKDRLRRLRDEVEWIAAGPEADLLAFEETGGGFIEVSARDLAHEARGRVLDRADAKDVEVVVHSTAESVWVRPRAFSEALCCLLENAIDDSRRGYPVLLDVRKTEGGDTLWQIHDHGQGLSADALAKLGQPQGGGWRSDAERGVAMAWGIIERHGGLLRFESATGVGTTVTLWLPRGRG